jgi:hypothetical protein
MVDRGEAGSETREAGGEPLEAGYEKREAGGEPLEAGYEKREMGLKGGGWSA